MRETLKDSDCVICLENFTITDRKNLKNVPVQEFRIYTNEELFEIQTETTEGPPDRIPLVILMWQYFNK